MLSTRSTRLLGIALLASCAEPTRPDDGKEGIQDSGPLASSIGRTRVTIDGDRFKINGAVTYPGAAAQGGLMNVRMVNSVFEDSERSAFDPERNTGEFVGRMDEYVSHGVRAFTVSLQGGYPGYEGARNSAFLKNGDLKASYLDRVERVIEEADEVGAVIILSLFYQRQDEELSGDEAVRSGVENAVDWIRKRGYKNVILEVVNEYGHQGFDHGILRTDAGVASLIRLAKNRHPSLQVSASWMRNGDVTQRVADAADFILVHFNNLSLSEIPGRIKALKREHPGKPIVCNEDDRTGSSAAAAAEASVEAGASYGLMLERKNQFYPFEFRGRSDDPTTYDRYAELTD